MISYQYRWLNYAVLRSRVMTQDERGPLLPWNFVNGHMSNSEFREHVLRTAWIHRAKAPNNLRVYADQILTSTVNVRGFRPKSTKILSAAYSTVKDSLNKAMWVDKDTSASIVALWADSEQNIIQHLKHAVYEAKIVIPEMWDWRLGIQGFYDMDNISDILEIVNHMSIGEEFIRWKYYLASLWLSGGLTSTVSDTNIETEKATQFTQANNLHEVIDLQEISPEINLSMLHDTLRSYVAKLEKCREDAKYLLNEVHEQFDAQPIQNLIEALSKTHTSMLNGYNEEVALHSYIETSVPFLEAELRRRPDLETNLVILMQSIEPLPTSLLSRTSELLEIIEKIVHYDNTRDLTLLKCHNIYEQITDIRFQLGESNITDEDDNIEYENEAVTLNTAQQRVETLQTSFKQLQEHLNHKREILIDQIVEFTELLRQTNDQTFIQAFSEHNLDSDKLVSQSLETLTKILLQLSEIHRIWIEKQTPIDITVSLSESSTSDDFALALITLAEQRRDFEGLLLLLSGYISRNTDFNLELSKDVVDSLIRGIEHIRGNEVEFYTFNRLAPLVMNRWTTTDLYSQAKIQLIMIAADNTRERLTEGTAWQFQQWALPNTPMWSRVWDAVLLGDPLPEFADESSIQSVLDTKYKDAKQALVKENGRYIRAGIVKSGNTPFL